MATLRFQVKEVSRSGYIAWDAVEEGSCKVIPLTEPKYVAGTYPEIEKHLREQHEIDASIAFAEKKGDKFNSIQGGTCTWTYSRGQHTIVVNDIPRTIFRMSGFTQ